MTKIGLLGHPLKNSLSPLIYYKISERVREPIEHQLLDVLPENLTETLSQVRGEFAGLNVTLPFKERVLNWVDESTEDVQRIGAANVLSFSGLVKGYNTDTVGIERSLARNDISLGGKDVLVLGAGGAARAVCFVLEKLGVDKIYVLSRTRSRAEALKSIFPKVECITESSEARGALALIVNTTPVGMTAYQSDDPEIFFRGIFRGLSNPPQVAFDLIYKPLKTPFMVEAEKKKVKTWNGIDMLVEQAVASWNIWFPDKPCPESLASEFIDDMLGEL